MGGVDLENSSASNTVFGSVSCIGSCDFSSCVFRGGFSFASGSKLLVSDCEITTGSFNINGEYAMFTGCLFNGPAVSGISATSAPSEIHVYSCNFKNTSQAIYVSSGSKLYVNGCTIDQSLNTAITSMMSAILVIEGTTITNTTGTAISISGPNVMLRISGCIIDRSSVNGISLALPIPPVSASVIKNNTVTNCLNTGILITDGPASIYHNTIVDNTLDLQTSPGSIVSHNVLDTYTLTALGALNTKSDGTIWNDPPGLGTNLGQLP
jgi:hypothetical protein